MLRRTIVESDSLRERTGRFNPRALDKWARDTLDVRLSATPISTMGATESRPEVAAHGGASLLTAPRRGYHVIRVAQGSPAQHAGLCVVY